MTRNSELIEDVWDELAYLQDQSCDGWVDNVDLNRATRMLHAYADLLARVEKVCEWTERSDYNNSDDPDEKGYNMSCTQGVPPPLTEEQMDRMTVAPEYRDEETQQQFIDRLRYLEFRHAEAVKLLRDAANVCMERGEEQPYANIHAFLESES